MKKRMIFWGIFLFLCMTWLPVWGQNQNLEMMRVDDSFKERLRNNVSRVVFIDSNGTKWFYWELALARFYPYIKQIPLESLDYLKVGKSPQLEQIFVKIQDPDRPLRWWGVSQGKAYWYKNNMWKSFREMIPDDVWNKMSQDAKDIVLMKNQNQALLKLDAQSNKIQNLACNLPEYWLSEFGDVSIDVYAESPLWYCKIGLYRWVYLPSKRLWATIYQSDFVEFLNQEKKDNPQIDQIFRKEQNYYEYTTDFFWNKTSRYIPCWIMKNETKNTVEFVHPDVLEEYCDWLTKKEIPRTDQYLQHLKATIVTQETAKTPEMFENKLRDARNLDRFLATRQEFLAEMGQNPNKDWRKAKEAAEQKYSDMMNKFSEITGENLPDIQKQKQEKIGLMEKIAQYLSDEERSAIQKRIESSYNKAEEDILKKNWGQECKRLEFLLTNLEKRDVTFQNHWDSLLQQKFYMDEQYRNQRFADYKEEAGRLWHRIQNIQSAIQNAQEEKKKIEVRAKHVVDKLASLPKPKIISEQEYTEIAKQYQDLPRDCELYNQNYGYYQQVTIADCQSRFTAFQQNWQLASTKFEAIQNKKLETLYDYETLQDWIRQYNNLALQAQEHTTSIETTRKVAEEWYGNISTKSDGLKNRYSQWKQTAVALSPQYEEKTETEINNTKSDFVKLQKEWLLLSQKIPDDVQRYDQNIAALQNQCQQTMTAVESSYNTWLEYVVKENALYGEINDLYTSIKNSFTSKQFGTVASFKEKLDAKTPMYKNLKVKIRGRITDINSWKAEIGEYYSKADKAFASLRQDIDKLLSSIFNISDELSQELSQDRVNAIPGEFQSLMQQAQDARKKCQEYLDKYGYCNASEVNGFQSKIKEALDKIDGQEQDWNDKLKKEKDIYDKITSAFKTKKIPSNVSFWIEEYNKLPLKITEHAREIAECPDIANAKASFKRVQSEVDKLFSTSFSTIYKEFTQEDVNKILENFKDLNGRIQNTKDVCKTHLDNYEYLGPEVKNLQTKVNDISRKIGEKQKDWNVALKKHNDTYADIQRFYAENIETPLKNEQFTDFSGLAASQTGLDGKIRTYDALQLTITEKKREIHGLQDSLLQKLTNFALKLYTTKQKQALENFLKLFTSLATRQYKDYVEYGVWKSSTEWYLDHLPYKLKIRAETERKDGWILEPVSIELFVAFLNANSDEYTTCLPYFRFTPYTFCWNNDRWDYASKVSPDTPVTMVSPLGAEKLRKWLAGQNLGKVAWEFPERKTANNLAFTFPAQSVLDKGQTMYYFVKDGEDWKLSASMYETISEQYMHYNTGIVFALRKSE